MDCSARFPGLKRSPGVSDWKVWDKKRYFATAADAMQADRPPQTLTESMFPPSSDESESLPLHRCMRVLPHQQVRARELLDVDEAWAREEV